MFNKNGNLMQLENFLTSIDLMPYECCSLDEDSIMLFIMCIDRLYAKFSTLYDFEYETVFSYGTNTDKAFDHVLFESLKTVDFFSCFPFCTENYSLVDLVLSPFDSMNGFQVENFYSSNLVMNELVIRFINEHDLPVHFEWLTDEKIFKEFSNYLAAIFNFVSSYSLEETLKEFFEQNTAYSTAEIGEIASKLVFSCNQDEDSKTKLYDDKNLSLICSLIFGEDDIFSRYPYFKEHYYRKDWLDGEFEYSTLEFSHTVIRSEKWYDYVTSSQEFKERHIDLSEKLEKCLNFIKNGFEREGESIFEGVYLNDEHKTLDIQFASGYDNAYSAEFTLCTVSISVYFALIIAEPLLNEFIELL